MSVGKLFTVTTLACTCSLGFGSKPTIASQTETGVFTLIGTGSLGPFAFGTIVNGSADFYIDADLGSARLDIRFVYDNLRDAVHPLSGPLRGLENTLNQSYLLSGKLKRLYSYSMPVNASESCHFVEFPSMPEPAQYFACVENLLASGKEVTLKDVYTINDPLKYNLYNYTIPGEGVARLHIEKDGGIRSVDLGEAFEEGDDLAFSEVGGFNATTTLLAKPDATMFDVPTAWWECNESKDPFSHMAGFTKTEQAWLKCFQSASSHDTLDIVLV